MILLHRSESYHGNGLTYLTGGILASSWVPLNRLSRGVNGE